MSQSNEASINLNDFVESARRSGSRIDIIYQPTFETIDMATYVENLSLHIKIKLIEILSETSSYKVTLTVTVKHVKNNNRYNSILCDLSSVPQIVLFNTDIERSVKQMTDNISTLNSRLINKNCHNVVGQIYSARLNIICLLPPIPVRSSNTNTIPKLSMHRFVLGYFPFLNITSLKNNIFANQSFVKFNVFF